MSDESQLQIARTDGNSALTLSNVRSNLIARGRRDAASLPKPFPPVSQETDKPSAPEVCYTCGEPKESVSGVQDDIFCSSCRSREQEISTIWSKWGFTREGIPLDGVWDDKAQRRDTQAKLEIDRRLEQLGLHTPWIDLVVGYAHRPYIFPRGRIQVYGIAMLVNQKWGFNDQGDPLQEWDDEPTWRTAAVEEIKKILAHLGLPLPDWDYDLNPFELTGG